MKNTTKAMEHVFIKLPKTIVETQNAVANDGRVAASLKWAIPDFNVTFFSPCNIGT